MDLATPKWIAESKNESLKIVRVPAVMNKSWEQWFLLSSDRHWDNPKSNRKLQEKHLNQAVERGAGVIDVGDFFCAMQGKGDHRGHKGDVRPEHATNTYLDSLIGTCSEWIRPWSKIWILLSHGNHETKVLSLKETDLTKRLCDNMALEYGSPVSAGGYSGWVVFQFSDTSSKTGTQRIRKTINLHWFHGSGGGGASTRGVQYINQHATIWPDADILVSGHIHHQWCVPIQRSRLTAKGIVKQDTQWHVCTPTYKDEFADGQGGWAVERGMGPRPLGAWWIRFWYDRDANDIRFTILPAD